MSRVTVFCRVFVVSIVSLRRVTVFHHVFGRELRSEPHYGVICRVFGRILVVSIVSLRRVTLLFVVLWSWFWFSVSHIMITVYVAL